MVKGIAITGILVSVAAAYVFCIVIAAALMNNEINKSLKKSFGDNRGISKRQFKWGLLLAPRTVFVFARRDWREAIKKREEARRKRYRNG